MGRSTVLIDTEMCENEQTCVEICPENVFRIDQGFVVIWQPQCCTLCFKCAESCSSGAIELDF